VRNQNRHTPIRTTLSRCCSKAFEKRMLRLCIQCGRRSSRIISSGCSLMNPRASASFCHWPKLISTPPGQVGPNCVCKPADRCFTNHPRLLVPQQQPRPVHPHAWADHHAHTIQCLNSKRKKFEMRRRALHAKPPAHADSSTRPPECVARRR